MECCVLFSATCCRPVKVTMLCYYRCAYRAQVVSRNSLSYSISLYIILLLYYLVRVYIYIIRDGARKERRRRRRRMSANARHVRCVTAVVVTGESFSSRVLYPVAAATTRNLSPERPLQRVCYKNRIRFPAKLAIPEKYQ